MGTGNRNPLRPIGPVDPLALQRRLSSALGGTELSPQEIVSQPFPEVHCCTDVDSFRRAYLLRDVLRKYPGFDLGIDTRKRALASFMEDEELNRRTNARLMGDIRGHINDHGVHRILDAAALKAVSLLGKFAPAEFVKRIRFGPGSTTSLPRSNAHKAWKLSTSPHVTSDAYELATLVLGEFPH